MTKEQRNLDRLRSRLPDDLPWSEVLQYGNRGAIENTVEYRAMIMGQRGLGAVPDVLAAAAEVVDDTLCRRLFQAFARSAANVEVKVMGVSLADGDADEAYQLHKEQVDDLLVFLTATFTRMQRAKELRRRADEVNS